jgi:hypothetical protein
MLFPLYSPCYPRFISVLYPLFLHAITTLSPRFPDFIFMLSPLSPCYPHFISTLSPLYLHAILLYLRATPALYPRSPYFISALSTLYLRAIPTLNPRYPHFISALSPIIFMQSLPYSHVILTLVRAVHIYRQGDQTCSLLRNFTRFDLLIYYIF